MNLSPPDAHVVFQGIACPACLLPENHIQDTCTGDGLNAFGNSRGRVGTKILMACENGHAWILGIGEHKGSSFLYVRLPLGGEVDELRDFYDPHPETLSRFRFSGRAEPADWHPRRTDRTLADLNSGVFA